MKPSVLEDVPAKGFRKRRNIPIAGIERVKSRFALVRKKRNHAKNGDKGHIPVVSISFCRRWGSNPHSR
ncbi:MAG TPA: hypothetical protein PLI51_02045 [bacterium]|nr:hypothetical protein [bacterium]HPQ65497.1 hypothetical protein [bacterium]